MDMLLLFVPVLLFFSLLVLGIEIAYALALSGIAGLLLTIGWRPTMGMIQSVPLRQVATYSFTTIPMFVLMAEFASRSGIISSLFDLSERLFSRVRGGLAMAVVMASAMLGALSGSSVGATGAIARTAVPEMERRGYSDRLSLGIVSSAGTLAVMIPPSIPLVIYGILTETSIGALLLAGIVPGLLTGVLYLTIVARWGSFRPNDVPARREVGYSWREKLESARHVWPFLLIVVVIVGGIYSGFVTATEAAAVGALATLLLWVLLAAIKGHTGGFRLDRGRFREALDNTLRTTTMIMILIVGAHFFGYYLTVTGMTQSFGSFIAELAINRHLILVLILLMYLVMGLFLSQATVLVLSLPIIFPLVVLLDFHPVWFGIMVTKMVEIGLVTPPVGMNVFVASGAVAGKKASDGFRGATPFLIADVAVVVLVTIFPAIVLGIPAAAGLI